MSLKAHLNGLGPTELGEELTKCCGSSRWVRSMKAKAPFKTSEEVFQCADEIWGQLEKKDILEAFSHHPKIGADIKELKKKFPSTKDWSSNEQSSVALAKDSTIKKLAEQNILYEKKYGFIFIVCATGKSAEEMLAILGQRIKNQAEEELMVAAKEQSKITRLRLEKLIK